MGNLKCKVLEKKSQCVQFVIVLQRDQKLGQANELNGYENPRSHVRSILGQLTIWKVSTCYNIILASFDLGGQ